jgi:6-pyruvoyltetrahydropterin/6-carboxytetrahydropterin synthase
MYRLAVKQDFIAQHFLVGGDWGVENQKHSHHYQIEVQLEGEELDKHGFLVDILNVNDSLQKVVARFQDNTLNELPEFRDLNPSIENFARISYDILGELIHRAAELLLSVTIREDNLAWTSYERVR